MAADESRAEGKEIPFGTRSLEHFGGIDSKAMEDQREFIDERYVGVTLRVLHNFRRFGDFQARRLVRARSDDAAIQRIDEFRRFRRRPRRHFRYVDEATLAVAGIDSLGTVADEEIGVEHHRRCTLEFRNADFLGGTGIYGRLIDDDIATLQH